MSLVSTSQQSHSAGFLHSTSASAFINDALRDGMRLRRALARDLGDTILSAARLVAEALRGGKKVMLFGNGGSAADAQHLAAEFVGRFAMDRAPLPALALTVDTSALTAIANDYGYESVFARQVRAHGRMGDVVIAISTSGRSPSVLRAVCAARDVGVHTIALTGRRGTEFGALCDICVGIDADDAARIQECHITVGHLICELIEIELFGERGVPQLSADDLPVAGKPKIVSLDTLVGLRPLWQRQRRTVVWTNGCFDLLHAGHLASLEAARALGDVLVVGVNADAAVRAAKGEGRPVYPVGQRAQLLAALEVVDYVVVFDEPTPESSIARLRPDIHCKGADYAPPNGAPIPEAALVESYGGRIVFLPLVPGLSTTSTLRQIDKT